MFSTNDHLLRPLWHNGPTPSGYYSFPNNHYPQSNDFCATGAYGIQRSAQPITTGTSVVGIKFDNGVMIAADNLISYGSTAKFTDIDRVFKINNNTILGAGGDYADFQCLKRFIDKEIMEDYCYNDNIDMKPKSLYISLTRVLYNRRSRFSPLWLDVIVGGLQNGVPFLGHIDLRGKSYQDDIVASGFGRHLALPYLRAKVEENPNLSQDDAEKLITKAMEILFYRDARAYHEFKLAICTKEGTIVKGPLKIEQDWSIGPMVRGE